MFPSMLRIRQEFETHPIRDVPDAVRRELRGLGLAEDIGAGQTVAITAGSRGIANIGTILRTIAEELRSYGAEPFIIPAMGSHGGATAEGQLGVLESFGITEASMGVPIRATMEVVEIGETGEGIPVFMDRYANGADHIAVVGRVKAHTDFKAPIESGLMKMMAIGLGKQHGADMYHRGALHYGFYEIITGAARVVLEKCPVAFGLALVEDQRDETAIIQGIRPPDFERVEEQLLVNAKALMPAIPFEEIDLLIIDEMGKDISGAGIDPNVIGRHDMPLAKVPLKPKVTRIFVRDLSTHTYGNAIGIGMADFTTQRLVDKVDVQATYMNCLTACAPESARIPMHFDTDREVLEAALGTLGWVEPVSARVVHIANTLHLEQMWISEALGAEARERDGLSVLTGPSQMRFDAAGNLLAVTAQEDESE
jgi:hypothetical protein